VGNHLVFGPSAYDTVSDAGRRLIAHELSHTLQQRAAGGPGVVIQRQARTGLGLSLPKSQIKAIGNADVNQVLDALPAVMTNGQTVDISLTTPDGAARTFKIEITIIPGAPPVTSTEAAKTRRKSASSGAAAAPVFAVDIYQALPDPVRTLFHELLHLRLLIDKELPADQRSGTFGRYSLQLQMGTDEALLRATGTWDLKKAVMAKIASVRAWFEAFVPGFKTPAALSAAGDEEFLQHFIEEKFVNQEAGAAKISPGRKKPAVSAPLSTETIARRYAGTVGQVFRVAVDVQNLQAELAAANQRARNSTSLPSLDDVTAELARALKQLFDALDAQLGQIRTFERQPPPVDQPKELNERERVDEALRTAPPITATH
jgi:hypothetical protein